MFIFKKQNTVIQTLPGHIKTSLITFNDSEIKFFERSDKEKNEVL